MRIAVDDIHLSFSKQVKILGLIADSSLRFREHVGKVLQRCYLRLRVLYANKDILNFDTRKKLADSFVLSIINYCLVVYYPFLDKVSQQRLQRVENTCCRFVCGLKKFDHVSRHIHDLKWLKLSFLFKFRLVLLIYRLFKDRAPSYLFEKLIPRNMVHSRNIRHITLTVPHHTTALFSRGFTYNVVSLFNHLRPDLLSSEYQFHKKYKQLFLQEQLAM